MDANDWDERYRQKDLLWTIEPNRFLVATVTDIEAGLPSGSPPGRALDLAAGEGRHAVWLAGRGWEVTAVEWSGVAISKGRRLAAHHGVEIEWVPADLTIWEPGASFFELVLILYLQVPRDLRTSIWERAARAVAPGGRLVIVGHDLHNLTDGYGGPSSAEVLFTADEVRGVLGPHLHVERADTVFRPVETDEGVRHAIDNFTVARRLEDSG
jgi:SAM-dependent methyltransferase